MEFCLHRLISTVVQVVGTGPLWLVWSFVMSAFCHHQCLRKQWTMEMEIITNAWNDAALCIFSNAIQYSFDDTQKWQIAAIQQSYLSAKVHGWMDVFESVFKAIFWPNKYSTIVCCLGLMYLFVAVVESTVQLCPTFICCGTTWIRQKMRKNYKWLFQTIATI